MQLFEQSYNIFGVSSFIYVSLIYIIMFAIFTYSSYMRKFTGIINNMIYGIYDIYLHDRSNVYILIFGFYTILILNLIGIFGFSLVLANPIYALTFCLFVCGLSIIKGMIKFGPWKFILNLVPKGVPWFLYPLMIVIELLTLLLRPFILAFRICLINSISHMILHVFAKMLGYRFEFILFIMLIIDIIKSFLQGYLFSLSMSTFLKSCLEEH